MENNFENEILKEANRLKRKHKIKTGRGFLKRGFEKLKRFISNINFKDLGYEGFKAVSNIERAAARKRGIPARDLEKGELHIGLSNYSGPGTKIDKYMNAPPIGGIDAVSREHDIDYMNAGKEPDSEKRALMVRRADEKAIRGYLKYPNDPYQKAAIAAIGGKLTLEYALSMLKGVPTSIYG